MTADRTSLFGIYRNNPRESRRLLGLYNPIDIYQDEIEQLYDRIDVLRRRIDVLRRLGLQAVDEWESWVKDQLAGTSMYDVNIDAVEDLRNRINEV